MNNFTIALVIMLLFLGMVCIEAEAHDLGSNHHSHLFRDGKCCYVHGINEKEPIDQDDYCEDHGHNSSPKLYNKAFQPEWHICMDCKTRETSTFQAIKTWRDEYETDG